MIELIYNEEGETSAEEKELWEPKNIRQVGEPGENRKIFIEDYVHTFLQQYGSAEGNENGSAAVLLGTCEKSGSKKYLFIKSALALENIIQKSGRYEFSERIWSGIYAKCGRYFPEQEILGWFLARPGFSVESSAAVEETHRTYFSGADKVLMMLEPLEGETGFFAFEQSRFARQNGYCIYYEKNEPMHSYMLEINLSSKRQEESGGTERAISNFRKILQQKQENNRKRKKLALAYGVRAGVFVLLAAGAVMLGGRNGQIQKETFEEESVQETFGDEVVIEELPGAVGKQQEIQEEVPVTPKETAEEEPAEEPPAEEAAAAVSEQYTVQAGDTLAGISRQKYGDEQMVEKICELNGIVNGDYIQVGETILLP